MLCWNIRHLNSSDKQLALSNAINVSGCAVICLQESKMPCFHDSSLKALCPKLFDKFAYIPSRGASGGIITIWNSHLFTGRVFFSEPFALGWNLCQPNRAIGGNWWMYTGPVKVNKDPHIRNGCLTYTYPRKRTGSFWVILITYAHRKIVINLAETSTICSLSTTLYENKILLSYL